VCEVLAQEGERRVLLAAKERIVVAARGDLDDR
jgi:hypothetical protein